MAALPPSTDGVPYTETDVSTFKDFLRQYNSVTEKCFADCVRDFTSRTVSDREAQCTDKCLDKYLKMVQRVSIRFQEYQMLQAETMGPTPPPK